MEKLREDYDEDASLVQYATDTLLLPVRVATSPVLLRTYLRTALLFVTSTILFGVAVVAYSSFYYSYIPIRSISVPIYLQYDHGTSSSSYLANQAEGILGGKSNKWPYGLANVQGLVDRQKYDVVVEMEVPRSDVNLKVGNWMLGLEMRGPATVGGGVMGLLGWDEDWSAAEVDQTPTSTSGGKAVVLARSKRPAILTYRSRVVETAHRLLRVPFYLAGWHTESEHIEVSMMESVVFEQGYRNIPSSVRLEVRSRQPLEVYRVKVRISARLEGLRWLMYKYWLTSAAIGIGLFWSVEMGLVLFTWGVFTLLFSSLTSKQDAERINIKSEHDDIKPKIEPGEDEPGTPFSDTSRTFPTLSSQQPLTYSSAKEERLTPNLEDIPMREDAEADDEDDDFVLEEPLPGTGEREGMFTDSGIGTSLESSVERGLARRRSGRLRDEKG